MQILEENLMTMKQARRDSGLTQKEMSEIFGIPIRTIGSWEDGSRKCPDYVKRLIQNELKRIKVGEK